MVQSPSWEATSLQLVKKFPSFHGTRRFITALTSFRHLSLSWASPIQSIYPHPTSWRSILVFTHLRLGLPSGLFPSGFPTKILYTPLSSPIRATCPAHTLSFLGALSKLHLHVLRHFVRQQRHVGVPVLWLPSPITAVPNLFSLAYPLAAYLHKLYRSY